MQVARLPNDHERARLVRWRISTFWVMLLGYIGYYLCRGNLSAAAPLISDEFQFSNTELGIIFTASEVAYAAGKFLTGPWADSLGGKRIFLLGMAGAIVFNLIFAQMGTLLMFAVVWSACRFFLSMGWGGIIKTIGAWYEPERNGTVMGMISINFQTGSAVAAIFAGWLIAMGVDWRGLFIYPALVLTGVWIWSFFSSKESPQAVVPGVRFGQNASDRKCYAEYVRDDGGKVRVWNIIQTLFRMKIFRQMLVFSFIIHMLRSIFMFWTPKYLVDIGLGAASAAFQSAVFPILGVAGTLLLGWYTDRYAQNGDRARIMWMMLTGLVVCMLAIGWFTQFGIVNQGSIVAFIGLSGFFLYGPYSMTAGCLSLDIAGSEGAGTCTGLIDGIGYLGGAVAAWSVGVLSDSIGWSNVFYLLAGLALLTVLSAYWMSLTLQARAEGV